MSPILISRDENTKTFEPINLTEVNQKIIISANIFVDPKNQTITLYSPLTLE
ncbi:MAG: hypothetical protein K2X69_03545 [Silvanigrellaceae bacterium]|nr:hypothetical protein [Silvanigrellaceae bacterium]